MRRSYTKHGFFRFTESGTRELWCVQLGETELTTICRVLEVSKREIQTGNGAKRAVLYGIVADDTAKLPFIAGEERGSELGKGNVVLIEGAAIRRLKGLLTLSISKTTRVRVIEAGSSFPGNAELLKPKQRSIGEILSCGGAFDILVEGDILTISGGGAARELIVDDGTGALVLEIQEKELEGLLSFGSPVRVRGNVVSSGAGYRLKAAEIELRGEKFILTEIMNFLCRYT